MNHESKAAMRNKITLGLTAAFECLPTEQIVAASNRDRFDGLLCVPACAA